MTGGRFWIFTFFGNSELAVHPHLHVNFFIVSLTSHLLSHLPIPFPSTHLSSLHSPSLTLLLFKYLPTLNPNSSHIFPSYSHSILIHNLSTTYPQFINKLSTAFPQVIHNPYLINRHFIYPIIPTSIVISPIIPIIIPT